MFRFGILVVGFLCLLLADYQVDVHHEAVVREVEKGSCDRVALAYDCSPPLHTFHKIEQAGLFVIVALAVLCLLPGVGSSGTMQMVWVTVLSMLLLVTLGGLAFEFIADGAERQFTQVQVSTWDSIQMAELFELLSLLAFGSLLYFGPPEYTEDLQPLFVRGKKSLLA